MDRRWTTGPCLALGLLLRGDYASVVPLLGAPGELAVLCAAFRPQVPNQWMFAPTCLQMHQTTTVAASSSCGCEVILLIPSINYFNSGCNRRKVKEVRKCSGPGCLKTGPSRVMAKLAAF